MSDSPLDLAPILRRYEQWRTVCSPRPTFIGTSPYFTEFYDHAPEDVAALAEEVVRLRADAAAYATGWTATLRDEQAAWKKADESSFRAGSAEVEIVRLRAEVRALREGLYTLTDGVPSDRESYEADAVVWAGGTVPELAPWHTVQVVAAATLARAADAREASHG